MPFSREKWDLQLKEWFRQITATEKDILVRFITFNFFLPPSGIAGVALHNNRTLQPSTGTCWSRAQSNPY